MKCTGQFLFKATAAGRKFISEEHLKEGENQWNL
jgi:hypothetical protein